MSSERKNSRLPPPAFPPGTRRKVHKNSTGPHKPSADPHVERDAFISPDDPFPPRSDKVANAFISPDEPLPARSDDLAGAFLSFDDSTEDSLPLHGSIPAHEDEGVVTGMGSDPHLDPEELATGGDPYVMEVAHAVRKLAEVLSRKGEAGLRSTPDMSRFEATLRAYCVGYVAGRRAEDEEEQSEMVRRVQPKVEPEL